MEPIEQDPNEDDEESSLIENRQSNDQTEPQNA